MSPEIRATLELESSDALSTVDSVGEGLTSALDEAIAAFSSSFDAALSSAASEIASLGDAPIEPTVTADVSAAEGQIDSLDATPVDIVVEADVSDADAAISDLGATATQAGSDISGASGAVSGLEAASGLATGSAAGLGSAIGELGPRAGAAVGGAAALAGALGFLAQNALDDIGATQRFNTVLGTFAERVRTINVGTLNQNLSDLAIRVGSTDDALQGAVSTAFLFAQTAGLSGNQAATFAERIAALSARAVALNPSLGDVGEAANRLTGALASGRERALLPFQLGLTQVEIKAHAAALGLASADGTVARAALAFAGADLAAKKFGETLERDVAKGSQNVIIQQRQVTAALEESLAAIAAPLVPGFLGVIRASVPLIETLGRAFTEIGSVALPALAVALEGVAGLVEAFGRGVQILADGLSDLPVPVLVALGVAAVAVGVGMGLLSSAMIIATVSFKTLTAAIASNPFGAVLVAISAVVTAIGLFGSSSDSAGESIDSLSKKSDKALKKIALDLAALGKGAALGTGSVFDTTQMALDKLGEAADTNIGVARRLGQAYIDVGLITESQFNKAIRDGTAAQQQSKADTEANTAAIEQQAPAVENLATKLDGLVQTAIGALPTLDSVLSTTASNLDAFGLGLDSAASPEAFLAGLQASTLGIVNFQANLQTILAGGFQNVFRFVSSQGPAVGGAYLQAFLSAPLAVQQATDAALAAQVTATGNLDAYLRGPAAGVITAAWTTSVAGIAPASDAALKGAQAAVVAATPGVVGAGGSAGQGLTDAFGAPLPGGFSQGVTSGIQIAQGVFGGPVQFGMNATAYTSGVQVGDNFARGIAAGIRSTTGFIEEAAQRAVRDAKVAADIEAGNKSPSKLFAEVGRNMGLGMAAGLSAAGVQVVAAAEQIVRDAASTGIAGMSAGSGSSGVAGGPLIDRMNVTVTGNVDNTATGLAVGDAIGVGVQARLSPTRARAIRARVRTRG